MTADKIGKGQVAFLGTGLMGAPMVANLLAAGWVVNVWNRTLAKTKQLEELGARAFTTPQEAVAGMSWVNYYVGRWTHE